MAEVRVSQEGAQALFTESDQVRVSQAGAQALYTESDQVRVSQVGAQILYTSPAPTVSSGTSDIDICIAVLEMDGYTLRRATEFFVDSDGNKYLSGLVWPDVVEEAPDDFYGVDVASSTTVRIEYGGGDNSAENLKTIFDTYDPNGCVFKLYHYQAGTELSLDSSTILSGTVDSVSYHRNDRMVEISIGYQNDTVLQKLLPPDVVSADLFDVTAVDMGTPINIPIGNCKKIFCPNVLEDTTNDYYDYCIGYAGIYSVDTIYREDRIVPSGEYTVMDGTTYPQFCCIRFTRRQLDFSGSNIRIFADVVGMDRSTGPATLAYVRELIDVMEFFIMDPKMLADPLGSDRTNLVQAVSTLEGTFITADMKWWVDYNIGGVQKTALDWLTDILQYMPISLYRNYEGQWRVFVDTTASPSYYLGDGYNQGIYDNAVVNSNPKTPASRSVKQAIVQYDYSSEGEYKQIDAYARYNYGVDKTVSLKAVADDDTALRILSRVVNRSKYSTEEIELSCGPDMKDAAKNELFRFYFDYVNGDYNDYRIKAITKNHDTGAITVRGALYSDSIYGLVSATTPTSPSPHTVTVNGPDTITGNYTHADATEETVEMAVADVARVPIVANYNGTQPSASYPFMDIPSMFPFHLPADLTGSYFYTDVAATGSTTLTIKKDSSAIGTLVWAASGTTPTVTFSSEISFAVGEKLKVLGPSSADSTLGYFRFGFLGIKDLTT